MERTPGKLGMKPLRKEAFALKFASYQIVSQLPPIPKTFGHFTNRGPATGMLANDRYGCCVMAGGAHETQVHCYAAGKPIPEFTDAVIVKQYLERSNGKDEGLDPLDTAEWRRVHGIADAAGVLHKLEAYALLDQPEELFMATRLYGCAGAGFWLPKSAEAQFARAHPCDDTREPPDPNRGHYVVCLGRNSLGLWVFSTWGDIQAATLPWIKRYYVGGILPFSREYLKDGHSPEGIDGEKLAADIHAVKAMPHRFA